MLVPPLAHVSNIEIWAYGVASWRHPETVSKMIFTEAEAI